MDFCPIKHAKAYPYSIPESSYVLGREGIDACGCMPSFDGRSAVIASGSNASPERLMAKYSDHPHLLDDPICVVRAQLHHFDVVYSAHIACYGAIPATLAHLPGAVADVFVTWLTNAQLAHMHKTEARGINYDYAKLTGIQLLCDSGAGLTTAHAYISKHGCLNNDGNPVPLAAINAHGRQWRAMNQEQVLDYARALAAPNETTDDFIRQNVDSKQARNQRTLALNQNALDHGWASIEIVR